MKHIKIYEAFMQQKVIPIVDILNDRTKIDFSVMPDKKTVVISKSDGKGGIVPNSSYKYSTQGKKGILSLDIDIKSISKKPDGSMEVKVLPKSSIAKNASASKIGPDGWITAPVDKQRVDDLISELIQSGGKKGELETKSATVTFKLIGPK